MKKLLSRSWKKSAKKVTARALMLATAIVLIPSFASGCRFGNKNETHYKGYDLLSGYYTTEPRTYALKVQMEGEASPRTKNETINKIPTTASDVIKNPFLLYFDDPITGDATIRNPEDSSIGFAVKLNADTGMFTYAGNGTMNSGTGCTLSQLIQKSGSILQFPARKNVNGYSTRGSGTIEYSVQHDFTGAAAICNDWVKDFQNCFATTNCDDESTSLAHFLFDPFVDAGLLTSAEIPNVRQIRWTATYLEPGI